MDPKYEDSSSNQILRGNFSATTDLITLAHAATDTGHELRFNAWKYDYASKVDLEALMEETDQFIIAFTTAWSLLREFILEDIRTRH